jgi:steroid 5-alpha reductase family enzyme/uncharacterized membrane protein YbaN (DUF454 family)
MDAKEQNGPRTRGYRRVLLIVAGSLTLALGVIGVVVPVLPTTPLLLLAAFCYARSSERGYRWLMSNRVFGTYLRDYLEGRGLSWRTTISALALLWGVLTITALWAVDSLAIRVLLLAVAGLVTVHILTLRCGPVRTGSPRVRLWGSRAISALAYLLALGIAVGVVEVSGVEHPLAQLGVGTFAATLVVFVCSLLANNSSLYDPYWSLQPLAIAVYYLFSLSDALEARALIVSVLVFLYALRLTSNFYRDWPGLTHEDFRYRDFRARSGRWYWFVSLFGIHLFPTLMVYLGCLPLYGIMNAAAGPLVWLDAVAALVTLGALVLAFFADDQLRTFRHEEGSRGKSIRSGLWVYSRHPNYLGEIATWWGLFFFAVAAGLQWWWTGVGALAITLMFVFVSVPMMERRACATREGYEEYRASTPMLVPGLHRTRVPASSVVTCDDPQRIREGL